ncbi:MAG: hypothetical protein C4527_05375 [Candidatus Omnitrophota bacterium]|jgi:hypothetical protein|nr:MAG: hypothetical protein C4527_05375 [Candidatus Omnitrophota bacterium]
MKQTLSFVFVISAVLLMAGMANADVYLSEDFNTGGTAGALSRGWEFVENEFVTETGANFVVAPEWPAGQDGPGTSTGNIYPPNANGIGVESPYLISDSDAAGGSDDIGSMAEIWAISPVFSTVGASEVWFHADATIEVNNNGEALALFEVTADNGATWLPVWICVEPERVIDEFNKKAGTKEKIGGWPVMGSASQTKTFCGIHGRWHVKFPDAVANKSQVRFRFGWYESADAWYMAYDNIVVDNVSAPMGSETLLFENFENGIPSTWKNTTGKTQLWGTRCLWNDEFDEPLKNINVTPVDIDFIRNAKWWDLEIDLDNPHADFNPKGICDGRWLFMLAGQGYAMWQEGPNTPAAGTPSESATLDTPTLNLGNATGVFLDFDSEMLRGNGSAFYDVFVSVDGGQNYERIFTYTGALMDNDEAAYFTHHYLEVPQAAGKSAVIFRFRAEGQDPPPGDDPLQGGNGHMSGFWVIDNVRVTANTGPTAVSDWALF